MKITRKIEVVVKTDRRYVIHGSPANQTISCPGCGEPMLTAESSANMFGISQRRIFQIVEMDAAHSAEAEAGALMICLPSLAIALEADRNTRRMMERE